MISCLRITDYNIQDNLKAWEKLMVLEIRIFIIHVISVTLFEHFFGNNTIVLIS